MQIKPLLRYLLEIAALAVIYHLAARLGLQMAYVQQNTSPVWPPSGIALAWLLIFGIRDWPGVTLGVVLGSLLTGAPPALSVGLGLANTLEALIGASLLTRRLDFHRRLDRVHDVTGLVLAAACATLVSATIGVATLVFVRGVPLAAAPTLWITWLIGNLLACLVITPLILSWVYHFPRGWSRSRYLEALVFFALLVAVAWYVFANPIGPGALHQALIYLLLPFAIWAALRLGQVGAATTVFLVSGIAIWGTIHGLGPFSAMPVNQSLILLQTFTGVLALTSLTLAASASEQLLAEEALRNKVSELAALNEANSWLIEQVRYGNEQLHALSHRLMEVQEAERSHLSRELHDESGQALAALMVNLGLLERDADSPALVRHHTADLKRIAADVLENLHALAVKLRPASLDHLGLTTAMQQYIQEFNHQYGLEVQFESVGVEDARLPAEIETALFRILQESLTNVALHAQATRVDVLLNRRDGALVLSVEDNGIGFNPEQPVDQARLGLFGMRERVEMLSGKLIVESAPGKGTMISVEVPDGDARPDRG